MEQIDYDIDDFINYCDYRNLSVKTIGSYEQTLRLFIRYFKESILYIYKCCNIIATFSKSER